MDKYTIIDEILRDQGFHIPYNDLIAESGQTSKVIQRPQFERDYVNNRWIKLITQSSRFFELNENQYKIRIGDDSRLIIEVLQVCTAGMTGGYVIELNVDLRDPNSINKVDYWFKGVKNGKQHVG